MRTEIAICFGLTWCSQSIAANTIEGEYDGEFGYLTVEELQPNRYQVWLGIGTGSCGGEVLIDNKTTTLESRQLIYARSEGKNTCFTTIKFANNSADVRDSCIKTEDEENSTCAMMGNYQKRE
ncbi:hypothetical protein [Thiorhodovibrio frisius]|uniref:hypothetical protein n=1 Tax=Thiorhodovibrio frisius TaxID=631362 RepID=UPI00117EF83A|nr:hypothetical protein [Thiorhodovibrio frisius]